MRALKTLALTGLLAASAVAIGGAAEAAAPTAAHRDRVARTDGGAAQNVHYYYRSGYYYGRPYYGYYRPYFRLYFYPPVYYRPYYAPYYYYPPPVYYYPY
jgi:hypothetical protein